MPLIYDYKIISFIGYSQLLSDAYRSVKQPIAKFSSFLMTSNVKQKLVCIFKHHQ